MERWKRKIEVLVNRRDYLREKIKNRQGSNASITWAMREHEALESALILMQAEYNKNKERMGIHDFMSNKQSSKS